MRKIKTKKLWAVVRIHKDYFSTIAEDIAKLGYNGIKVSVPCVRILVKRAKNQHIFKEIPLLFYYGFVQLPMKLAINRDELEYIKNNIGGITGWLYVPKKELITQKKKLQDSYDDYKRALKIQKNWHKKLGFELEASLRLTLKQLLKVYHVPPEDIPRLEALGRARSIFSQVELSKVKPGDFINLKGYPFSGLPAQILEINKRKQKVRVKLVMEASPLMGDIELDFENVFYTIYTDFNESKFINAKELATTDPNTLKKL